MIGEGEKNPSRLSTGRIRVESGWECGQLSVLVYLVEISLNYSKHCSSVKALSVELETRKGSVGFFLVCVCVYYFTC